MVWYFIYVLSNNYRLSKDYLLITSASEMLSYLPIEELLVDVK